MRQRHCPECGKFMREMVRPEHDLTDARGVTSTPDWECECGHAIFDTAKKEEDIVAEKLAYERETGFLPYR